MIHFQKTKEEVFQNNYKLQEIIKKMYDQKKKVDKINIGDVALHWGARDEDKENQDKFENLWEERRIFQLQE